MEKKQKEIIIKELELKNELEIEKLKNQNRLEIEKQNNHTSQNLILMIVSAIIIVFAISGMFVIMAKDIEFEADATIYSNNQTNISIEDHFDKDIFENRITDFDVEVKGKAPLVFFSMAG